MGATATAPASVTTVSKTWMTSRAFLRSLLLLVSALVLTLGAIEDIYGNTDSGDVYGSDAVQYLDIARAINRHDWHSALNPLWSQGYPALLAMARPLFPAGPSGDWTDTRAINFAIFTANYLAFLWLLRLLIGPIVERDPNAEDASGRGVAAANVPRKLFLWMTSLSVFVSTQVCLGQVSRVNPDELVTVLFFCACGLLICILRKDRMKTALRLSLLLGVALGIGFLVKAVFLALGCCFLLLLTLALWSRRRPLVPSLLATTFFALIVGGYGIALSHAVGHFTLGEAGSINYAWHVNRLEKWVHWEGGRLPASEAWPKASIARFAQWDTLPPDFGTPVHPSAILQESPRIYGFTAPFHATYAPYFNPPYWYEGYRHVVRPRYQAIAILKSFGDLAQPLVTHAIFFAIAMVLLLSLRHRDSRQGLRSWMRQYWPIAWVCTLGVAIYLPVHLEPRYIAAFAALLPVGLLIGSTQPLSRFQLRAFSLLIFLGFTADLLHYQLPIWKNLVHHKDPRNNSEWKAGDAVLKEHLPPLSQVGVIAWTPNLHSDWAYIGQVQITSEIASPKDMDTFWNSSSEQQAQTLSTFHKAGAVAVIAQGKPADTGSTQWQQLSDTKMWIYRF